METGSSAGEKFQRLVEIMARLRAPDGCPWDREQTLDSIKPYTLEETYELLDAIDRREWSDVAEELGDFLLQAVFFAEIAAERNLFRMEDALDAINRKLVRRHPHVFGEGIGGIGGRRQAHLGRDQGRGKEAEGPARRRPAGHRAARAAGADGGAADHFAGGRRGLRLGEAGQVLEKLHEELAELEEARGGGPLDQEIEDELGDLLFVLVNLARFVKVDPEQALRKTNAKFRERFAYIERRLAERGRRARRNASIEEMEAAVAGSQAVIEIFRRIRLAWALGEESLG